MDIRHRLLQIRTASYDGPDHASRRSASRTHGLFPDTNAPVDFRALKRVLLHMSITRSAYFSARFRGWCVLSRGTRLRFGRGSAFVISRGSFIFIGFANYTPTPCSIHLGRGARISITGTVNVNRGVRIFVNDGGLLEIANRSYINDCSTVTCFEHIKIGSRCAVSWNTNILDSNIHELLVGGASRPRSRPVIVGDDVWIGTGATVLAGSTIGDGSVVAAGSVVTAVVPSGVAVAGNPARIVHQDVRWRQ